MFLIYLFIIIVIACLLFVFITYYLLKSSENKITTAFNEMDVYLKKRWDLIPSLVEIVKGHAINELATLENVLRLRNGIYEKINISDKLIINENLTPNLNILLSLNTKYPNLNSVPEFANLKSTFNSLEASLIKERGKYNAAIASYNKLITNPPTKIIADLFLFKTKKTFEQSISEEGVNLNETN